MKHFQLSILAAALLLASCSPKFYTPNAQNVPLLHEEGQVVVNANISGNRAELQGAYAFSDNFAAQVNGGLFFPENVDNGDGGKGHFYEGGIGYYKPIYERFVFETYALVGAGGVSNDFPSTLGSEPGTNGQLSANIFRYGVQPSIGFYGKYFALALSSRIAMLNYSNISGNLVYASEDQQNYLRDNDDNFLLEPALTLRVGINHFKVQLQMIRSYNFSNPKFKQDFNATTLGVCFDF